MAILALALAAGMAGPGGDLGIGFRPGSGVAWAADPLPEQVIRAEVARLVPPLWRIEEIAITPLPDPAPATAAATAPGTAPGGTAAKVSVRLSLSKPTYLIDSRDGPFTFVRPVADPSLQKTLEATVTLTRTKAGRWEAKTEARNPEVLEGIGRPASELPGHTVLVGSEEARKAREQIALESQQRLVEEQARQKREEALVAQQTAAARAEAERMEKERRSVEARVAQIAELRGKLLGADRGARIAAYEAAMGGNDTALRQLAFEAAVLSRDPLLGNLALKDWLARRRALPVQLFATKEDSNSETVLHNLGPLTVEIDSFNPVNGAIAARMGAPGYSIAKSSNTVGSLAQTELTLNSYGCTLALRLTEQATLDGLFRCQTLPALIARITLD